MSNFPNLECYYQMIDAKIFIEKGTMIAQNCRIVTTNHDINNLEKSTKEKDIVIGKKCWIGMNCVIFQGVVLGEHTIVSAGSVVTKSFEEGNCVIAGNPAKIIRTLEERKNEI